MKKILILFLVLVLVFSLAGCGVKEKIESKVTEKVVEKVIESAVEDENAKIDIDGGKVTITDKETGSQAILGGTEWPDLDYIPEFREGKVVSVIQDNENNAMIVLEDVEQKDFEEYLAEIKDDYTENVMNLDMENVVSFGGENGNGYFVQLMYETDTQSLTIIANRNQN